MSRGPVCTTCSLPTAVPVHFWKFGPAAAPFEPSGPLLPPPPPILNTGPVAPVPDPGPPPLFPFSLLLEQPQTNNEPTSVATLACRSASENKILVSFTGNLRPR